MIRSILLFTCALFACVLSLQSEALDLLPDIFKKREKPNAVIWDFGEQYVQLENLESGASPNDHPVAIDTIEIDQALASLQLWIEGGVFRDEEAVSVYPRKQAAVIAQYVSDALAKASPNEDVTFNVRGYADVLLSMGKEREWTTGRVFYVDGKLNLIIGEYQKRLDKSKKMVEGSFGITEDYREVYFAPGSRKRKGKMPGRVVTTAGVELGDPERPDWIVIDVPKAALAYRESQVPVAVRKEEIKAKQEAAKLTLERRQMREEMARMRKELDELRNGGDNSVAGGSASVEERLERLADLHRKGLISEEDLQSRRADILSEI